MRPVSNGTQKPERSLLFAAALALSACGPTAPPIDAEWHRRNAVEHLGRLLAGAPTPSGALNSGFNRAWEPLPKQGYGATTQGRGLYALATGYQLTGDAGYARELARAADFLLKHGLDAEHGGAFEAYTAEGKVANPGKRLYGQAFALFGLAHAYRVTKDSRYLDAASATWMRVRVFMREPSGGYVAGADRLFMPPAAAGRNVNPVMHLFEALLALYDATGDRMWLSHARDIAEFVVTRLAQDAPAGRRIPEFYDADWKPLPPGKGGYYDLGHQVEWAWLLSAGAERGLPAYYVETGAKLLDYAIAAGYDRERGGLFWRVDDAGKVSRDKLDWVQSEFLRAVLRYVVKHGRADLKDEYEQSLKFLRSEFLDERAGWYPRPRSECERRGCLDSQGDVGYHLIAMHIDALMLSGATR